MKRRTIVIDQDQERAVEACAFYYANTVLGSRYIIDAYDVIGTVFPACQEDTVEFTLLVSYYDTENKVYETELVDTTICKCGDTWIPSQWAEGVANGIDDGMIQMWRSVTHYAKNSIGGHRITGRNWSDDKAPGQYDVLEAVIKIATISWWFDNHPACQNLRPKSPQQQQDIEYTVGVSPVSDYKYRYLTIDDQVAREMEAANE